MTRRWNYPCVSNDWTEAAAAGGRLMQTPQVGGGVVQRVLFVHPEPATRLQRHAMALSQTGIEVHLAAKHIRPMFETDMFASVFDYSRPKGRLNHILNDWFKLERKVLLEHIRRLRPDVVHVVVEPNREAALIVRDSQAAVVVDGQDFTSASDGVENVHHRQRGFERMALENCDGLLFKGPPEEVDYYAGIGWKLTDNRLNHLDWCQPEWFAAEGIERCSEVDGRPHLVYAGHVARHAHQIYVDYTELGSWLGDQRIHLPGYPTSSSVLPAMVELDRQSEWFHLHEQTPFSELVKEMARYDLGVWRHQRDPNNSRSDDNKLRTAMGNKLFAYLEAGLPVLINPEIVWGAEVIDRHGVGIVAGYQQMRDGAGELITMDKLAELRSNVLQQRCGALGIADHIDELLAFYGRAITARGAKLGL